MNSWNKALPHIAAQSPTHKPNAGQLHRQCARYTIRAISNSNIGSIADKYVQIKRSKGMPPTSK